MFKMTEQQTQQTKQTTTDLKINTNLLLDITKILKGLTTEFITEFNLKITLEGLNIKVIDPAHICFIDIEIKKNALIDFNFKKDQTIGFNTIDLYKVLKNNKKTDLKLSFDNDNVFLSFDNGLKSQLENLKIDDPNTDNINLDYQTELKIDSKKFKDLIKHFSGIAEGLKLSFDNDNKSLKLSCLNNEIILKDLAIIKDYPAISKYPTEYLKKVLSVLFTDNIILKFNNDYPITLIQQTDLFKIKYIIAPRIEND